MLIELEFGLSCLAYLFTLTYKWFIAYLLSELYRMFSQNVVIFYRAIKGDQLASAIQISVLKKILFKYWIVCESAFVEWKLLNQNIAVG